MQRKREDLKLRLGKQTKVRKPQGASGRVAGPTAEAFDPVLEVFKRGIDFTLVERNLRLSREERAQQLVNASHFIRRFRPLVQGLDR